MAAALLQDALERNGQSAVVASAGTGAWAGAPASEGAYLVSLEHGLDLSAHRATMLTKALVDEYDVILTMSRTQLARVRELGAGARAHLLTEFAGASGRGTEIGDPFGGTLEEYRETFQSLRGLMPAIAARIGGMAQGSG